MLASNDAHEADLIDAIYELALDATAFDNFILTWEAYLQQRGERIDSERGIDHGLLRHFERAFETIQRSTPTNTTQDPETALKLPTVELKPNGEIVRSNRLAEPLLGKITHIQDGLITEGRAIISDAIEKALSNNVVCPALISLRDDLGHTLNADSDGTDTGPTSKVPLSTERYLLMIYPNDQNDNTVLANLLSLDLHEEQMAKLIQLYGLSAREAEIARMLYQGHSIRDIAEIQNRALETVRKQAKTILAKTGTNSQGHLMRIMASANLTDSQYTSSGWQHSRHGICSFMLADGRNLSYYDSLQGTKGAQKGAIVVLHGVVHDPELPREVDEFLTQQGYRVIGVVRAWFGQSSPASKKTRFFDTALHDLHQLVNDLGLESFSLVGIQAGSLHALNFASTHPALVKQVVAISGMVPIRSDDQLKALPIGLRAVAKSARFLPSVLPTLISGGLSLMYKNDFKRIFNIVYRNSPVDLQATNNPEVYQKLVQGFNFTLHNGYHAYTGEGIEIMSDQSAPIKTLECPITYINGELDGLTSIDTVQAFCDDLPRAQVIRIQKMGNLFFYSSPQLLLHSLKTIF